MTRKGSEVRVLYGPQALTRSDTVGTTGANCSETPVGSQVGSHSTVTSYRAFKSLVVGRCGDVSNTERSCEPGKHQRGPRERTAGRPNGYTTRTGSPTMPGFGASAGEPNRRSALAHTGGQMALSITSGMVPKEGNDGRGEIFSLGLRSAVEVSWVLIVGIAGSVFFVGLALGIATSRSFHGPLRKDHVPSLSPAVVAVGLLVIGTGCLIVARFLERPLDGSSDRALSASWQRRFFVWVGVGEIPLFLALATIVATGRFWLYPIGSFFTLICLCRIAPTSGRLARYQEQLTSDGYSISLRAALDAGLRRHRR